MNKLFIQILNWNGEEKLKNLYPSLIKNLSNIDHKILIKDNGSTDKSTSLIKSWENPNVCLFEYPNNLQNYSEGMNYLFDRTNCDEKDFILTLNNDVVFNDDTSIGNIFNIIKNDTSVGLVGAKLNYTNSNKIQHCGVLFHPRNGLPFHFRAGEVEQPRDRENRMFPMVTGAVSLTRSSIYKQLRMPEQMKWSFDDSFFSMQVTHDLKLKAVVCGKTNIFHEESASLKKNPVNKMFMSGNVLNFLTHWKGRLDTSLVSKYLADPKFNVYKKEGSSKK